MDMYPSTRKVKAGESFRVFSAAFSIANTENSTPKIYQSLDNEHFYDTSETIAAQDVTNVYVGITSLYFKVGESTDTGEFVVAE